MKEKKEILISPKQRVHLSRGSSEAKQIALDGGFFLKRGTWLIGPSFGGGTQCCWGGGGPIKEGLVKADNEKVEWPINKEKTVKRKIVSRAIYDLPIVHWLSVLIIRETRRKRVFYVNKRPLHWWGRSLVFRTFCKIVMGLIWTFVTECSLITVTTNKRGIASTAVTANHYCKPYTENYPILRKR